VHPGAGGEGSTLVHGLLHHVADLRGIGGELRPGIVHRLDKETSGCLVVAKSEDALRGLQAAFKGRRVEKRYLALAHGQREERGEMDTFYGRHPVERKRFSSKVAGGKRAQTRWTRLGLAADPSAGKSRGTSDKDVLATRAGASLAEVELLTGRTHQIRAHFADAGHPLLGDALYGGKKREAKLPEESPVRRAAEAVGRHALHAELLAFEHPVTNEQVRCSAPLPPEFRAALELLGITYADRVLAPPPPPTPKSKPPSKSKRAAASKR
jgi:23S rRNA pseudouridine1911/1915/1917 synthase